MIRDAKFANLSLTSELVSEVTMSHLFNIIKSHKVQNLSIEARMVYLPDSVATLKELSSLVQSLHIKQMRVKEIANMKKYFFGALDVDWAPIFIEMLFGKTNQLWIENYHYLRYIGKDGKDLLIKYLPRINKKIAFHATCGAYEYTRFMRYDYEVEISRDDCDQSSESNVLRVTYAPPARKAQPRETAV